MSQYVLLFYTVSPTVPSSAPIGLSSTVQGSTSVLLSWSPPPAADQNGVITVYTVEVINTVTSNKDTYVTSSSTLTVVSLDPYTTYECIVAANTSVGMGPFSAKLAFQTVEAGEYTITRVTISIEHVSNSFRIQFQQPHQRMCQWRLLPPLLSMLSGQLLLRTVRMVSSGPTL